MLGIPFPAHILGSMLRWSFAWPFSSKKVEKGHIASGEKAPGWGCSRCMGCMGPTKNDVQEIRLKKALVFQEVPNVRIGT